MGWDMPWYTVIDSFDADFGVDEWHGHNAFIRDGDRVFRTYFINSRGDEAIGIVWSYLDMTALGRQETWEDSPEGYPQSRPYKWWNWHDAYVPGAAPDPNWVEVSESGEAPEPRHWRQGVTGALGSTARLSSGSRDAGADQSRTAAKSSLYAAGDNTDAARAASRNASQPFSDFSGCSAARSFLIIR
jgi:Bacterial protein of unknown function (DUF899)